MKSLAYSLIFILSLLFCISSCDEPAPAPGGDDTEQPGGETPGGEQTPGGDETPGEQVPSFDADVTYKTTDEDFINPERGWYCQDEFWFEDGEIPEPKSVNELKVERKLNRSLTLMIFYPTDFMEGDISEEALNVIDQTLANHREAGCKAIIRFSYKDDESESNKPWDPTVEVVLRHIEQVKPILHKYEDVLYVLQAGFVGVWGEWYYTDHFNQNPTTDEDFAPRKRVLEALLDAVPQSRQVQLRTPEFKMKLMGVALKDTITAETAFNGSDISRVGGHNDCFLASSSDYGTFDGIKDRELWKADSRYTIMGGETCNPDPIYCNCEKALAAVQNYHWSYLHISYHRDVISIWQDNGCYKEISRRLGYRLVLLGGKFGDSFEAGKELDLQLQLKNEGFASIMNERHAEFVIVAKDDPAEKYTFAISSDPRRWGAGQTCVVSETITLPAELKSGKEYKLCLNLPDAAPTLAGNPAYSIRCANKDVWESTTGYNVLKEFTVK